MFKPASASVVVREYKFVLIWLWKLELLVCKCNMLVLGTAGSFLSPKPDEIGPTCPTQIFGDLPLRTCAYFWKVLPMARGLWATGRQFFLTSMAAICPAKFGALVGNKGISALRSRASFSFTWCCYCLCLLVISSWTFFKATSTTQKKAYGYIPRQKTSRILSLVVTGLTLFIRL